MVGKYRVDVGSFETLSLPALAPQPGTRLLVIDEVGERRHLVTQHERASAQLRAAGAWASCYCECTALLTRLLIPWSHRQDGAVQPSFLSRSHRGARQQQRASAGHAAHAAHGPHDPTGKRLRRLGCEAQRRGCRFVEAPAAP